MKIKLFTECVSPLSRNSSNVFPARRERLDAACPALAGLLGGKDILLEKGLRVFSVEDIRKFSFAF